MPLPPNRRRRRRCDYVLDVDLVAGADRLNPRVWRRLCVSGGTPLAALADKVLAPAMVRGPGAGAGHSRAAGYKGMRGARSVLQPTAYPMLQTTAHAAAALRWNKYLLLRHICRAG